MTNEEKKAIVWLEGQHKAIMACEQAALALLEKGDVDGYRAKMREKAQTLAKIAKEATTVLSDLPEPLRTNLEVKLSRFASSAETSLALDSVFYMSALLYPDDHKKGEPDNLAKLIQNLKMTL